ncbi:dyf-5 [Symbiodinium sp. CCMP2456]|nr:dyf-5 [Symbiodinium sp. CCMP2456]
MGSGASKAQGAEDKASRSPVAEDPEKCPEGCEEKIEDRYRVTGTDVLGIGNFSIVRKGCDIPTGEAVAVKSLKAASSTKFRREVFLFEAVFSNGEVDESSPISRRAFNRSATVVKGSMEYDSKCAPGVVLTPNNLFVQLLAYSNLDVGMDDSWSVLELGDFTLHDLVLACGDAARGKKPHCLQNEAQLRRVLVHVNSALAFLHSRCFIHGDMKPSNIMWFGQKDRWKLIDMDGLRTPSEVVDMRDAEFYTAIYAAPEIARAVADDGPLRLSRRLDVWSVGLSVLEMKLLRPVFQTKWEACCAEGTSSEGDAKGGLDLFFQWLSSAADPLQDVRTLLESEGLAVLGPMLLLNPLERISPAQLQEQPALKEGFEALPKPSLTEEVPVEVKPKSAWQLFQEAHRAELVEQGFAGPKIVQELHRRWKQLQAEGGEELRLLQAREAELRAGVEERSKLLGAHGFVSGTDSYQTSPPLP